MINIFFVPNVNKDVFLGIFRDEVKIDAWFMHDKVVHGLFVMKLGTPLLPVSLPFNPGAVFGLSAMHISTDIPHSSSCQSFLSACSSVHI